MSDAELTILEEHFGAGVEERTEGNLSLFILPVVELPAGCTPAKASGIYVASPIDGYDSRLYLDSQITLKSGVKPSITTRVLLGRTMYSASIQGVSPALIPHQAILAHIERYEKAA